MSFNKEIAEIRIRLASARSARDGWRASGRQEKYLEAYFLVESLEAELDRLRKQGVRSLAR